MSSYICTDAHISALAGFAARNISGNTAQEVAATLYAANAKSVASRYRETPEDSFEFDLMASIKNAAPVAILKSVDCLEYQSCDDDGWEHCKAFELCAAIRRAAIRQLPGYEDASWG